MNWQQAQRQGEKEWETAPCALANRQAGQLMVAHQGAARSWHTRAEMAGSPHLSEDRAPSPILRQRSLSLL